MINLPRRFLLGSEGIIREVATKKTVTVVSNEVLIMLTLICALICMAGLAMVARCAWYRHSNSNNSSSSPEEVSPSPSEIPLPDKGVNKKVLQSIPKLIFTPSLLSPPSTPLPNGMRMATDCPICLAEFEEGDEIRVLPRCMHVFHLHCVDTWFGSHSSCPFCRQLLGPVAEVPPDGSLCHTCGTSTAEGRSQQ